MGLATLTCVLPITLLLLFLCLIAGIVAAAKLLHWTHGLAPGPFSAGFYLATLLLVGAGGWQLVESVRVFLAQRSAKTQPTDEAFPEPAPKANSHRLRSVVIHQPWMLLGTLLLLVDVSLLRLDIRGRFDSPDGLLAAAILASMVWATVFVGLVSIRTTMLLWRTLLRGARRSPYVAGWVTASCVAISLVSVWTIRHYAQEVKERVEQQSVVASIEDTPAEESSIEEARQVFLSIIEPKKPAKEQDPELVKAPADKSSAASASNRANEDDESAQAESDAQASAEAAADRSGVLPAVPQASARTRALPTPAAAIPVNSAAPSFTEPDSSEPFLGLSFGPPFAVCVDRLTARDQQGDPIELHMRRIMARFDISEHDARAIVMETLVSVCMKKGEDREDLRRYFWRSVSNAARNYLSRHLNGRRTCSIELVPVVDLPDEQESWRYVDDTETRAQRAFCELSEIDQALIQARVVRGLKFAEIGALVELSEDGARKAFDRAVRRLKEEFKRK